MAHRRFHSPLLAVTALGALMLAVLGLASRLSAESIREDERQDSLMEEAEKPARKTFRFEGKLWAGESFLGHFGEDFTFRLDPTPLGWEISVRDERDHENIARLSPPLHGPLNPLSIEGWQFSSSGNDVPNQEGTEYINAPGNMRSFLFSPEVGREIDGKEAHRKVEPEDISRIAHFGRGVLTVKEFALTPPEKGKEVALIMMRFETILSLPVHE